MRTLKTVIQFPFNVVCSILVLWVVIRKIISENQCSLGEAWMTLLSPDGIQWLHDFVNKSAPPIWLQYVISFFMWYGIFKLFT